MRARVVFGTYNGLLDPLGKSQILAYLERLHRRWPVHILSYERPDRLADGAALSAMSDRLRAQQIGWTRLRYHKWPSLLATTYDLACGVAALRLIMLRNDIRLFHSRGYLPMAIATRASRSLPILFDIRGLQPEEYVDGGVWREGELKWRLAKRDERRFFARSAAAVVLTEKIRPVVEARFAESGRSAVPLAVIPCCVELSRFRFDPDARVRLRGRLGVGAEDVVLVYSGSIGTWYRPEDMARFAAAFREVTGRTTHLLWLVNNDADRARAASTAAGLAPRRVHVARADASDDVPAYLSAADAAMALITPSFSKQSSSPTKYAECLAMGLPIVIHDAVGDGADLVRRGAAVGIPCPPTEEDLRRGARALCDAMTRGRDAFRSMAEELFDIDRVAIPRYTGLYQRFA